LQQVNVVAGQQISSEEAEVEIHKVEAAEMDELWSFVGKKAQQRWWWHAIDHTSGVILAYVCGAHEDEVFLQWKEYLRPFGISQFYTDNAGVYRRHLAPDHHEVGKQHTQKIERKHLTLRTRMKRLARKTIGFSKSLLMHDMVLGLFVNRYEFALPI
jgi:insertion element IS1 protein InsB